MSNNEVLITIEATELTRIHGGNSLSGKIGPLTVEQTNYESCLETNQRQARDRYPDNRWFFQKWMGKPDPNAGPRAEYERAGMANCTAP